MKVRVLHNPKFLQYSKKDRLNISTFIPVAEMEVKNLEEAYERTNTIEDFWWNDESIKKLFEGEGCRSTSPGDVIVDLDNNEIHVVDFLGFSFLGEFVSGQ